MAKKKGKKFKTKGGHMGRPNAKMKKVKVPMTSSRETIIPGPVPLTHPAEAADSYHESQGKEKEDEKIKHHHGFVFMCNSSTKPECYQYRVFGLPSGKKDVVEEIKPGTKLFLYDFELKLLYGVYEATSAGNLNLEPSAFRGKYPAQVKFKIFKECLPLPESSLRQVIHENYTGSKFKQELSKKQVGKLISSFRPLAALSSQPAPGAWANVSLSQAIPPSAMRNQFQHSGRLPVMEVPHLSGMQYNHPRPLAEAQTVPVANYLQHGYTRKAAFGEHLHPTLDHQSLPATSSYYVANSQRPFFTEGVAHGLQEQEQSYSRYRPIEISSSHAQVTSLERYRPIQERAPHGQVTSLKSWYPTVEGQASRYGVTIFEQHHHHQLPSQRDTVYQDNFQPAQYTSSVMQAQVLTAHPPYHPQPPVQYQDNIAAQNYSDPAAQAKYTASVLRPQVAAYSNSDATITTRYNSSAAQSQALAHQDPLTYYYSYSFADQLSRQSY